MAEIFIPDSYVGQAPAVRVWINGVEYVVPRGQSVTVSDAVAAELERVLNLDLPKPAPSPEPEPVDGGSSGGGYLTLRITEEDGVYSTNLTAGEIKAALEAGVPVIYSGVLEAPDYGTLYLAALVGSQDCSFGLVNDHYVLYDQFNEMQLYASSLDEYLYNSEITIPDNGGVIGPPSDDGEGSKI